MQNTIVRAFEKVAGVRALVFDEGGSKGETQPWLETWWDNYYLRGSLLFDPTGASSKNYQQPSTGLPFGRGFIVGRDGRIAHAYFGHRPQWVIERLEELRETYLAAGDTTLSAASGGKVDFSLLAGKTQANRGYALLAGFTGTSPGLPLPGGLVTLPLNFDLLTSIMIPYLNTPGFAGFLGALDGHGNAQATLATGPFSAAAVGVTLHFAYLLTGPFDFVSNPVALEIVP